GREDPADQHGEFAVRGGILDVFPAGETHPVRLEFVGDTIESLRTYDPATQRSIAPVDQLTIVPLRDVLGDDRAATLFDFIALAHDARIIVSERDEVDANATKLLEQLRRSYEEAVRKTDGAASRLAPPEQLFTDWTEIAGKLAQGASVAELGLDDDATPGHVRCQPAVGFHGRIADWVYEIRRLRETGETILFVAATAGRAERTIELLKEYEVLAAPVERAEDARYAAVLVALGGLSRGFRLPDAGL